MKKWIAAMLAVLMLMSLLVACGKDADDNTKDTTAATNGTTAPTEETTEPTTEPTAPVTDVAPELALEGVMSYADYMAAEMETEVTVACWVQATQSWWEDKITVYAADKDGAYFLYELACSEDDAKKMTPGTLIKVTGTKGEWAGEVEIMDGTFEFVEGYDKFVAKAIDLTDKLENDDLINYQNQLATFKGMTVKEISFKNDGGDDIYLTLTKNDTDYNFCVEVYLTGTDTAVYTTASALKAGDVVDVTGYLYWYEGMNPHVVGITAASGAMSYDEYVAAELESEVTVECYVQATQSWWEDKITVYAADEDGAYFLYELACSEEDSKKLTPGTKIKVTGTKGEWSGEVEIMDGTFEFVESADKFVAEAVDLTDKIASEDLINYQNQLATFKGMTVKEISFKNDGGDDIYLTLTKDGKDYNFCVEVYLTGTESEVYMTAEKLKTGDVVDVTGYLYWYEGMNPHVVGITAA